jgi:hypothetical protein
MVSGKRSSSRAGLSGLRNVGRRVASRVGKQAAIAIGKYAINRFMASKNKSVSSRGKTYYGLPKRSLRTKTRGRLARFRRRRRPSKPAVSLLYGATKKMEWGGTATSDKGGAIADQRVLYVGHSTMNRTQIYEIVCRAIVRKLFMMADINITNWNDNIAVPNGNYTIAVLSFDNAVDTTINGTATSTLTSSSTYSDAVVALETAIRSRYANTAGAARSTVQMQRFTLEYENSAGKMVVAKLDVNNSTLTLNVVSKFAIQNRTKVGLPAATDDDDVENANNIENNPLVGYRYTYSGNQPMLRGLNTGREAGQFMPGIGNGFVSFVPSTTEQLFSFHHPPAPSKFRNVTKYSKVHLAPGDIKTSTLVYQKKFYMQKFFELFKDELSAIGATDNNVRRSSLGISEFIGLSKKLDSRSAQEPVIETGWELTQTFSCAVYMKNSSPCNEIMEVVTAAQPQL